MTNPDPYRNPYRQSPLTGYNALDLRADRLRSHRRRSLRRLFVRQLTPEVTP